jgi:hypothetical protein
MEQNNDAYCIPFADYPVYPGRLILVSSAITNFLHFKKLPL